jgi:hypothetical protein
MSTRNFDQQDDEGEQQRAQARGQELLAELARRIEQFLEPADAVPEELVVAERVLNRIIHDGHQRQDGRERHDGKDGQDEEPGPVVDDLRHAGRPPAASPATRWPLA